jgi:hypothetical protein
MPPSASAIDNAAAAQTSKLLLDPLEAALSW